MSKTKKTPPVVYTPHDHAFRASMALPEVYEGFFQHYLPKSLLSKLDCNSIEHISTTFVDEELRLSASDVIFKAKIDDRESYISVLVEHQSTPDKYMPVRIRRYVDNILSYFQGLNKRTGGQLPFIYPVVVYHGEKIYPYSTDIRDLLDAPADVIAQYWDKPLQIVDLNACPDEVLKQQISIGALHYALKHIRDKQLKEVISILIDTLRIDLKGHVKLEKILLNYYAMAGKHIKEEDFLHILEEKQVSSDVKGGVMTVIEQVEARGIAKGEARGIAKGEARGIAKGEARGEAKGAYQQTIKFVRNMLTKGMSSVDVAEIADLSLSEVEALARNIQEPV